MKFGVALMMRTQLNITSNQQPYCGFKLLLDTYKPVLH